MPTRRAHLPPGRWRGFTLLELLVVLAILAIATAGAALALRDPGHQALQREGERLAALLEGGRAWSRSTGQTLTWRDQADGYSFEGRQAQEPPTRWLHPDIVVEWPAGAMRQELVLGPEPIIAPQSVVLRLREQRLRLSTDGLQAFAVGPP